MTSHVLIDGPSQRLTREARAGMVSNGHRNVVTHFGLFASDAEDPESYAVATLLSPRLNIGGDETASKFLTKHPDMLPSVVSRSLFDT